MRRYVVNKESPDLARAKHIRELFQDAPARRTQAVPWTWPREMQEVGECLAIMYASNKWQKDARKIVDYKHNREAAQRVLVTRGFLREYHHPGTPLEVVGPWVELNRPMPDAFAVLAPILGIQVNLYTGDDESPSLSHNGKNYFQVNISGAKLGAAVHPKTKETFLLVYTKHGLHCVITGDELAVQKDGITG